jgi:hypothetical protein
MKLVIVTLMFLACACSKTPGAADAATRDAPACPACPACAACPEIVPCPECEKVDAVYYSMLHRIERGRPESYVSTAFVHRAGRWYQIANVFPDRMEGPSAEPMAEFAAADALMAHVRVHPADVGVKTIGGTDYMQRGRVVAGWQAFDRIDDAPGIRASLATVFVLLE